MPSTQKTLAVIGAGPKAAAIMAKCAAMKQVGIQPPKLLIVERSTLAANWEGHYGYTDGSPTLGTPPDKDVGFPYWRNTDDWKPETAQRINEAMLRFSWPAFLITRRSLADYSDWIDRGRPAPNHKRWHEYLRWVFETAKNGLEVTFVENSEVCDLSRESGRWNIRDRAGTTIQADGVVVTGPGEPLGPISSPGEHPYFYDGKSFWRKMAEVREFVQKDAPEFVVVGTGETAAAVVVALLDLTRGRGSERNIKVFSRRGFLSSRGESYVENAVFTGTGHVQWQLLPVRSRREFISRTDRSVFSASAMQEIGEAQGKGLEIVMGEVKAYSYSQGEWRVEYRDELTGKDLGLTAHVLIDARGFDSSACLSWLAKHDREEVERLADEKMDRWSAELDGKPPERRGLASKLEYCIEHDLSVAGLSPKLHLPMLSALQQGPGLPNLSCLGMVSDRILSPYVEADVKRD